MLAAGMLSTCLCQSERGDLYAVLGQAPGVNAVQTCGRFACAFHTIQPDMSLSNHVVACKSQGCAAVVHVVLSMPLNVQLACVPVTCN